MKQLWLYLLLSVPFICSGTAGATELLHWQRIPLAVDLHTGHERVIFVNKNVRVAYPSTLDGKLRIQSAGGAVYLKATEDFPATRLALHDTDSGGVILLDVSAGAGDALEPLELRYDSPLRYSNTRQTDDGNSAPAAEVQPYPEPLTVLLTRYAAQMLYAPLRTVEPLPGISQVPLRLPSLITTLLPDSPVTAVPLNAWRLGDFTVSAIKLQNRTEQHISLDPRTLQGQFLSAAFQHQWLGAKGTPEDTTVVYLVSDGAPDLAFVPEPAGGSEPRSETVIRKKAVE